MEETLEGIEDEETHTRSCPQCETPIEGSACNSCEWEEDEYLDNLDEDETSDD